ncbi:MAG: TAXI family TRAP transporter solute-binding subunit [Paracoccaceae bacterium]
MTLVRSLALAGALSTTALPALAQETFVTIGTGGQTGVYYVVGQSIAKLVNRGTSDHGIRVTAPSTGGSVANLNAIKSGDMDMGVAQSDWQYHAYNGSSKFEGDQFEGLRALFSVHPEPYNVVARAGTEIEAFEDLEGKIFNMGNPGSGQHATTEVVLEAMGWTQDDFAQLTQLKASEQAAALCDNKIDAFAYVVGHPNGSIEEAMTACDTHLVSVQNEQIDKLVNDAPYYAYATIPAGTYGPQEEDVTVFGVRATFVTSAEVPEEVVYTIVSTVFDNFDRFKSLHPAFANLNPEEMVSAGLSAPIHPGAMRYYKEKGWLEGEG